MPLSGKKLVRLLQENGWTVVRIRGSHHILKKGTSEVSVPVHGNRSLGIGLERKLLKFTGVTRVTT
jgi:predicted RNA binding protein YcfA (HicA-like mRNA interferase family)